MVSAYEEAGVRVHLLEPDPALPYQVFARDSSAMTPGGAVITQLHQWWRRGEYAAVIRFYQEHEIPIRGMITAGALEGGDVMIVEPGCAVIGTGEERTQEPGGPPARRLAGGGRLGGPGRADPGALRPHRRAARDAGAEARGGLRRRRSRPDSSPGCATSGFEILEVPADDAFELGVNAISLGDERVLSIAGADRPERRRCGRAGSTVSRPRPVDVHPGRRRRPLPRAGASPPSALGGRMSERAGDRRRPGDRRPARARRAHRRADGAQRVCWGAGWRQARSLLGELLGEIGLEAEPDEAGNLWASLEGDAEPGAGARLALDSVPDGGWLDGALGVMAALGVAAGVGRRRRPPAPDAGAGRLGRRGGRALRPQPVRQLGVLGNPRPGRGCETCATRTAASIADVLAENGVELDRAPRGGAAASSGLGAYLELHIEQGPVLEAEGLRAAAVTGCAGVERHRFRFTRPGLARGHDPDGPPARRRPRRGRDGAAGRADRATATPASRPPACWRCGPGFRPRSPARQSCSSTCATPTPASWPRCWTRP